MMRGRSSESVGQTSEEKSVRVLGNWVIDRSSGRSVPRLAWRTAGAASQARRTQAA